MTMLYRIPMSINFQCTSVYIELVILIKLSVNAIYEHVILRIGNK